MSPNPETSSVADGYLLGRSYSSSSRLNLQHYLWKDVVGFNIHPDIAVVNHKSLSVADVGTGTGIWLIDLSRELPSARLDGFDISDSQYPPKEWLPKNISLNTLDILKPIPSELRGKYDIVHIRLFFTVVRDDNPLPILNNAMDMLKPGGYLQWSEHNPSTMTVESIKPGSKTDDLKSLVDYLGTTSKQGWLPRLPDSFREQGFQNVSHRRHPISPEVRAFFTHIFFMAVEEYSLVALDNSDDQKSGPAARRRVQVAAEEAREGVGVNFIPEVTVGRKPL